SIGGGSTETPSQAVAVTPDGKRVIFGTATGILIVDAIDGHATASPSGGWTTTSVRVTPDGGFVVCLTSSGELFLFDIRPGSATENVATASPSGGSTSTSVRVTPHGGFRYVTQSDGTVDIYQIVPLTGGSGKAQTSAPRAAFTY